MCTERFLKVPNFRVKSILGSKYLCELFCQTWTAWSPSSTISWVSLQSCMNVKVTSTVLMWRSSACSETEVTLKSENSIICCYFAINIYILDRLPAVWWQNRRWNTLKVTRKKHTNSFHDYFFILTGGRYHSSLTLFHSDCLSCSAFMVWMLQGKQVYVAMPSYWWQLSVTLTMKNLNEFFLRQVLHSKGATVLCHRLMPSLRFIC